MNHLRPFAYSVALSLCVVGLRAQKPSFDPNDNKVCSRVVHWPIDMPFDDKTFGFDCALEDEKREKAEFALIRKSIEQRSPEEIAAYESLVAAFHAFYKLHERNEGCHGGSYGGETMELDHANMQHEFLMLAKAPIAGNTDSIKADLARTETSVTRAFRRSLVNFPDQCPPTPDPFIGCTSRSAFRATERAWIRYREAWATFARLRWPATGVEPGLIQLNRWRARDLDDLPDYTLLLQ